MVAHPPNGAEGQMLESLQRQAFFAYKRVLGCGYSQLRSIAKVRLYLTYAS
jgi:hypothetical protein